MPTKADDTYQIHIDFLVLRLVNYGARMSEDDKDEQAKAESFVMRSIRVARSHKINIRQFLTDTLAQYKEHNHNPKHSYHVDMLIKELTNDEPPVG